MSKVPFWISDLIDPLYDINILTRKNTNTKGSFEAERKSKEYLSDLISRLKGGSLPSYEYIASLEDCADDIQRCERPFCPSCSRLFRRWIISKALKLCRKKTETKICTVIIKIIPIGELHLIDLPKTKDILRKRLRRSGFCESLIYGGLEVAYKPKTETEIEKWILHAHLLITGSNKKNYKRLRRFGKNRGIKRSVKTQLLRDELEQISYLLKFITYFRPGDQFANIKSRPLPLPQKRLIELLSWSEDKSFSDFLFLYNLRRTSAGFIDRRGVIKPSLNPPTRLPDSRTRKNK